MGTDSRKRAVGDKRVPLLPGTQLNVTNSQGGQIRYTVEEEIGRGGSSLVYAGYYTNNSGVRKPVRIKECYPFRLRIERKESGELAVESRDAAAYEKSRARMQEAFRISNELYGTGGLTNSISNILDLYKANNTVYMISTYLEGAVLAPELFDSLKDAVAVVKSVAETIRKIQERGYLYLDIKPENVFVLKNVTEMSVLFDFDSLVSLEQIGEEEGEDIRCTSGFAALEQRTGSVKHIGKHTDVYGVGALLFYLLFERTPNAFDCDMNVIYDYSYSKYASYSYRDKLYYTLTDFFHHTLSSAWQDRYPDLTEAVAKLEEIERLADLSKPFICDSYIPDKVFMTGREKEEKKLVQWLLDREKKCLFVTGMGGIGKSTLVRSCISRNRAAFDTILYLYYNGSLSEMIGDDRQLCVNTVERLEKENDGDYFKRKLHVLRKILSGTGTLLVIDNFSGKADEDFCAVLQAGWKVIFITRNEYRTVAKEYDSIKVEAIQDRDGLYELFAVNMGRTVREEDTVWLNLMISKLQGHTLAMELLAKQIAKSYLTVREAAELAGKHGFAAMAPEKVGYVKDGRQYFENISGIITDLFSVEQMSWKKKIFMRMLALFAMPGVEMKDFRQMLDVTSLDLLNELQEEGWLQIENRQSALLSLHPVIRETVRQWEWSEEYNEAALQVMQYLYVKLRIQGQKEVQPVKGKCICKRKSRCRTTMPN